MNISYRRLLPEHHEAYRALRLQAVTDEPQAFSRSPDEIRALPASALQRQLGEEFTIGAFHDRHLVGIAGYYIHEERKFSHRGYVHGVYLLPEYRGVKDGSGCSIAMQLMTALIDHARQHVEHLELSSAWDPRVIAFYEKLGFREYGRFPKIMKLEDGSYVDDIYMWMDIRA